MTIAIPVHDDCVSPAFDFAGGETRRSEALLVPESAAQRAARLQELGVDTVICGAVSRDLAQSVAAVGIELLAYVTGRVDSVLKAYETGQLARPCFTLPGWWPGARNGFRRCRRRRRGRC